MILMPAESELSGIDWESLFTTLLGDQTKEEQLQPHDEHGRWGQQEPASHNLESS
jgi:hypothetical protein